MSNIEKLPVKLVLGAANVGDTSADPMARFDSPDQVNAFFDVFAKHGYNQIDTAAVYSPQAPYTSEPRIGAASAGDRFSIDTKADWYKGHTKESVLRDIGTSLKNLKIDQINVYYLHVPDRQNPFEPPIEAIDQAYREGKIKTWGISNYRADEVQKTLDICEKHGFVKPSVYQGSYNPIARSGEKDLFPVLRKHGIAFYAYSPAASGFFVGSHKTAAPASRFDPSVGSMYMSIYAKPAIDEAVDKALVVAAKHNMSGHSAALRWTAHHGILNKEHGDAVIVGASSLEQLERNLAVIEEGPLPEELVVAFDAIYKEAGDQVPYHM
ncbi:potassium channel beta subunit [Fusarium heterosporum]|uniref:Potassium channel beta subunit n=1 Tax=Fusarium heterosporum TaxID=42747 RepID=A0A8H5THR7_FUSHE|nr:potassium channel beta subunit [Fusarium heterosporum]